MPEPAVIALTPGEPAGIGPDLCVLLAQQPCDDCLVIIGDEQVLQHRAQALGLPLRLRPWQGREQAGKGLYIETLPAAHAVTAGQLNPANVPYVLHTLKRAADGCLQGEFDAMVTGPVHKGIINEAGISFSGHTEFLAQHSHTQQVVMMLVADTLRVALVTTHLPLAQVSRQITPTHLRGVIEILYHDLQQKFHIRDPLILVSGLNPHAGEDGHLGHEEHEIIEPVLVQLRAQGMHLRGPLPADTLFTPNILRKADAVLVMYHDQGLPVLKHVGFGRAVNITLGLPFIRTSVDHGTALERAASGDIDSGSLQHAIALARTCIASHDAATTPGA